MFMLLSVTMLIGEGMGGDGKTLVKSLTVTQETKSKVLL